MSDNLKTIQNISKLYDLMTMKNNEPVADAHKRADQKLRFYGTQHGIIIPDNWHELSLADKLKRLDKMDNFKFDEKDE
tara:strand:+ start:661 stop:894 length:234 start_codon:yes stop_codon:yes gene_type:complete